MLTHVSIITILDIKPIDLHGIWAFIEEWYYIPLTLVYIGVVLTIIIENRKASKALAYILILVFVPILGLIVFFLFGRDFRKEQKFRRKVSWENYISQDFLNELFILQEELLSDLAKNYGALGKVSRMLFNHRNAMVFPKNSVTVLKNGESKFPELFKELKKAEHHIHIEYYILTKDDIGNALLNILISKAIEGVQVRVIADGVGSGRMRSFRRACRKHGIRFRVFMPVRFTNLASSNYRNHRKIVVIDGKTGFIGGINMDDRYLNNGKHELYWRDNHLKITGPAVNSLQFHFMTSWKFTSKEIIPIKEPYFNNHELQETDSYVSIITSGPISKRPYGMDAMVNLIYAAKESVYITNPYYIPSDELSSALINTSRSGVKVKMLLPGISDSRIVQRATFSYLKPLAENGIEIYLYRKGFVHSKTMIIDKKVSVTGSLNADIRSFYINFEASAIVFDEQVAGQMEEDFNGDLQDSRQITLEDITGRSIGNRLLDSTCRLMTPLL